MTENIRGIECSLGNEKLEDLLLFLSNNLFDFYIPWCMKIANKQRIVPQSLNNLPISLCDLKKLAKESIWELVLHIYPVGASKQVIETYDDFLNSQCHCCLIFYDCGLLDIYIKNADFRDQLYSLLLSLSAKDMKFITDLSDSRTCLFL